MEECTFVSVPKEEANRVISHLLKIGVVRKDLKIRYENGEVLIPVKEEIPVGIYSTDTGNFQERNLPVAPTELIERSMGAISSGMKVPPKYILLGNAIIFKDSRLKKWSTALLGKIAEQFRVESVYLDTGIKNSVKREPEINLLYGPGGDTIHQEGDIKYCFDPSKVMFSPGNVNVRLAKREEDFNGKTVIDMFAGIGYFSLHAASRSKEATIYACEINPVSFHYLQENIRLNSLGDVIIPVEGDSRKISKKVIADYVIMGHFECPKYIAAALLHSRNGTVIDFHMLLDTGNLQDGWLELSRRASQLGYNIDLQNQILVKSYGPHLWHVVCRISVTRTL